MKENILPHMHADEYWAQWRLSRLPSERTSKNPTVMNAPNHVKRDHLMAIAKPVI